jgi:MFS family permease
MKLPQAFDEIFRLPTSLKRLALAHFVNRCGTMVVAFLSLYFVKVHQLSLLEAGWLVALYSWGSLTSAPLAAWMCERWDACRVLTFSLLSAGTLMLAFPFLQGWPAWSVGCFSLGLLAELGRPSGYTASGRLAPPDRLRQTFTLHRIAVNAGMAVGPALGGLLATHSYSAIFWVDGATSLLAAGVVMGLRSGQAIHQQGQTALSRTFYRYLVGHFLGMVVFCQLFVAMPIFLVKVQGHPETYPGLLFTLNTLLILALEVMLTHATRDWDLRRAVALGYSLQGLGLGLLPWSAVVGVLFFTFGEMLQCPANSAYLQSLAGGRLLGRANAWFVACGSMAFIMSPPWVGWMLSHHGPTALWGSLTLIGFVAALWMLAMPKTEPIS